MMMLLLKLLDLDTSYIKKIRDIFVTNTKNKSENLLPYAFNIENILILSLLLLTSQKIIYLTKDFG